jgi:hypothetical protein
LARDFDPAFQAGSTEGAASLQNGQDAPQEIKAISGVPAESVLTSCFL